LVTDSTLLSFKKNTERRAPSSPPNPHGIASQIASSHCDSDGASVLKASVTTVPEGGKANVTLIKILAKELKLAKSAFQIVHGATDRNKTLHITGDPDQLFEALQDWASEKLGA
jgi:uncharacterized protein YggU (UPF0235/DUF167 family)